MQVSIVRCCQLDIATDGDVGFAVFVHVQLGLCGRTFGHSRDAARRDTAVALSLVATPAGVVVNTHHSLRVVAIGCQVDVANSDGRVVVVDHEDSSVSIVVSVADIPGTGGGSHITHDDSDVIVVVIAVVAVTHMDHSISCTVKRDATQRDTHVELFSAVAVVVDPECGVAAARRQENVASSEGGCAVSGFVVCDVEVCIAFSHDSHSAVDSDAGVVVVADFEVSVAVTT